MLVLGVNGDPSGRLVPRHTAHIFSALDAGWHHDASAALVRDGHVVVAAEEERFTRRKFEGRFPVHAIDFCLRHAGLSLDDLDAVAFGEERGERDDMPGYSAPATTPEGLREVLEREFGPMRMSTDSIRVVNHHRAHAQYAYSSSGFARSLVLTYDGFGDFVSTAVWEAEGELLRGLAEWPPPHASFGYLYSCVLDTFGYRFGGEYKVMGLAPYGDASVFRGFLEDFYRLEDGGQVHFRIDELGDALSRRFSKAPPDVELSRPHMDLAAAIQDAFERCAMHVLEPFVRRTGCRSLCIGGGCGQNSAFNGRLAASGMLDELFIPPGATDAGNAIGAALCVHHGAVGSRSSAGPIPHCYWGPGLPAELEAALARWSSLVTVSLEADVAERAAEYLARGDVLGWMQGRMEFGPRALGNRSILADPRPVENKDRINALIKKREGYRPFAPVVRQERLHDFFMEDGVVKSLPFMTATVQVEPSSAAMLSAVTHVDGSARVQTVSEAQNERLWALLGRFEHHAGIPVLLNTSFNNNAEPIVCSVDDALVCLLTSDLQCIVVGDFWVEKRSDWEDRLDELCPRLCDHSSVHAATTRAGTRIRGEARPLYHLYDGRDSIAIPQWACTLLTMADGKTSLRGLLARLRIPVDQHQDARSILRELWERRAIEWTPA
ncbi:MAG: carbamoyltransferase C-terminal domain-containing protein [Nannocystaceae bacterium]